MILSREESRRRRRDFVASLDPPAQFTAIFDHLRGVHFFVKEPSGIILFASLGLAKLYGFDSEEDFIGRTDFDVLPVGLAKKFQRDDEVVMSSGEPMVGIVELFPNRQGIPDWYLTNKLPLRDQAGRVVGLMGSIQKHRAAEDRTVLSSGIEVAVARLRANLAEDVTVSELAAMCKMSVRQFQIKFKEAYGLPPSQFRVRLRVMRACQLLRNTDAGVGTIAEVAGFYDQSALAHHFKAVMGYSPLQYRKRFDAA